MNTATNTFKSADLNTDFEVRTENSECVNYSVLDKPLWSNLKFTVAGILFGIILVKSEVISLVPHTGNVSLAKFSHVWGHWSLLLLSVSSAFLLSRNLK